MIESENTMDKSGTYVYYFDFYNWYGVPMTYLLCITYFQMS